MPTIMSTVNYIIIKPHLTVYAEKCGFLAFCRRFANKTGKNYLKLFIIVIVVKPVYIVKIVVGTAFVTLGRINAGSRSRRTRCH